MLIMKLLSELQLSYVISLILFKLKKNKLCRYVYEIGQKYNRDINGISVYLGSLIKQIKHNLS